MKKAIFILILSTLLISSLQSNAQGLKYGVKLGLNSSSIYGDEISRAEMKVGYYLGAFLQKKITETLVFQPEIQFSAQGCGLEGMNGLNSAKFNLYYLSLPLIGKYYISDKFNLQFGPRIGLNIGANISYEGESASTDTIEGVELGLDFGFGYNIKPNIELEARYHAGLMQTAEDIGANTILFQVGASYVF
jgi:hypothetical protein